MLKFNALEFKRIIVHHIAEKQSHQDSATAIYEKQLFEIPEKVDAKIKERLTDACGKNSKAFELEIEETGPGSFFALAHDVHAQDDLGFISRSSQMADRLAHSQTKNRIPGGKFIVIDARADKQTATIVIKAELHEAIQQARQTLNLLDDIFLSPAQKLFKIGVLYTVPGVADKKTFKCLIYDEQFRADSQPAEYFYKAFLGFGIGNNSKIQSKRFFDKTEKFIWANYEDTEKGRDLVKALKYEFSLIQETTVTPKDFADKYFKGKIKDSYLSEVAVELPPTIVKDSTLLESILNKRKLSFPNEINVQGPEENFEKNVKLITTRGTFEKLNFDDSTYSIVRINGKPFLK